MSLQPESHQNSASDLPLDWESYGIFGRVAYGQPARAYPFTRKIHQKTERALALLAELDRRTQGRWYTAVSFGVDSLVALDLARRAGNNTAVWINQGPLAEWPDCLAVKNLLVSQGLDLIELQPEITLYRWYQLYGVAKTAERPVSESGEQAQYSLFESLILNPIKKLHSEQDWRGFSWGVRGVCEKNREALYREILLTDRGLLYQRQGDSQWVCSPVGDWSKIEIWAYLDLNGLPYPAMYDRGRLEVRNGPPIGTSATNLGRVRKLKRLFPEIWRVCVLHFPDLQRFN